MEKNSKLTLRMLWETRMPTSLCTAPNLIPDARQGTQQPALAEMATPALLGPRVIWRGRCQWLQGPRPWSAGLSG